jgi:hypothetical protein
MTQPEFQPTAIDCIVENIFGFMLPFFLSSAGGDADLGRDTIRQLAESFNAATATEIELVGRILGFSTVAMDNLRLSMKPDMSDTKVLRYRSNAIALSRAGEQCRKILEAMQANRQPAERPMTIPRPAIAAAPPPVTRAQRPQAQPPQTATHPARQTPHQPNSAPHAAALPADIEAMRRDARTLLAAFPNGLGSRARAAVAFPKIEDPDALVGAAVREAVAAARRTATL